MSVYKVILKSDRSIVDSYSSDSGPISSLKPWQDESVYAHVLVFDNLDPDCVVVNPQDGGYIAVEDDGLKREKNQKFLDAYSKTRGAQAETDIQAAMLSATGISADYTTHLMIVSQKMYVATNVSGSQTEQEINDAKIVLLAYLTLYSTIQTIRSSRDADIAAFTPPHPEVSPLYPS